MLTWQLPVKRSPISIYKISNGQFSFWVKTFANTDCLQKKSSNHLLAFLGGHLQIDIMFTTSVMMLWRWCGKLGVCKFGAGTTTYFRTPLVLWVAINFSRGHRAFNIPPTSRWQPFQGEGIAANGRNFEAQKICTVVVECTHNTVRNCLAPPDLVQPSSHQLHRPKRLSLVLRSNRSNFRPLSLDPPPLTGEPGGLVWSCYVLFCSPLLPCCFAHTHNVVVVRLETPRLGLDAARHRNAQKCRRIQRQLFIVQLYGFIM